jgi:hypothetical protein
MASSGMLRSVPLVRTDVSEERSASFIRVTRIGELGTTLAVRQGCMHETDFESYVGSTAKASLNNTLENTK